MLCLKLPSILASFLLYFVCVNCSMAAAANEKLTIYVSVNGSDNELCWTDGGIDNACRSIAYALEGVQETKNYEHDVILEPGEHSLNSSVTITQVHDLSITGSENSASAIICTDTNTGVSFQHSKKLHLSNLLISGCGATHYSTNRDLLVTTYPVPFLNFTAALHFEDCSGVTVDNLEICDSDGTGVAFFNTGGTVQIQNSHFINNSAKENSTDFVGGSGAIIYFSFCLPGISACMNEPPPVIDNNSDSRYEITNCSFSFNKATTGNILASHHPYKPGNDSFNFGRGGGLAVFFKGNARNNLITITDSTFACNKAEVGAGMYVSFEDRAVRNTVRVTGADFKNNTCHPQNVPPSGLSSGGGLAVRFMLYGSATLNNQAFFERCDFHMNGAYQGGGVSILSTPVFSDLAFQNKIRFDSCNISRNEGRVGAGVNIFQWFEIPLPSGIGMIDGYATALPSFHNCTFHKNGHRRYNYSDSVNGPIPRSNVTGSAFGAIYIEAITTDFSGPTTFSGNHGSAMVVQSANVNFLDDSFTIFTENIGRIGAGIALLGDAHMTVFPRAVLHFINNTASEKGGAIFSIQTEQHHTGYSHVCFLRYHNIYTPPSNWTSQFRFQGNSDYTGNISLHVSSLLPCVWPSSANSNITEDLNNTLCGWKNWIFDDITNCSEQIRTSPVFLHSEQSVTNVYPGLPKKLNITAYDELYHNVTSTTIFTVTSNQTDLNILVISDTSLQVYSNYKNHTDPFKIYLQTFDTITVSLSLLIQVLPCPPAWTFNSKTNSCFCDQRRKFDGMLTCDFNDNGSSVYNVRIGSCVGYCKKELQVIAAQCPFSAGYSKFNSKRALEDLDDLNENFCKNFNRTGELCSKCIPGMGVSPYSARLSCVPCNNGSHATAWLKYFAYEFGLETVIFMLVFGLHIGITTAPANGFVFFSQIMSMPAQVLIIQTGVNFVIKSSHLSKLLTNLLIIPYGIVGMEFHYFEGDHNMCLSENLTSLHILALQYAGAVYPILLSILALLFIELHARGYRVIVCIGRPLCFLTARFRQTWKPATSIIDAFATFTLLAYTKIIRVSFSLLSPSSVVDIDNKCLGLVVRYDPSVKFFGSTHKVFAALSIIMLLLGILPILFLLLYPFKCVQKCFNRLRLNHLAVQMFAEAFQGCYKNGSHKTPDRRFYAGIYFFIKFTVFAIYTILQSHPPTLFWSINTAYILALFSLILLLPYKNNFYNCLDAGFFVLLILNNYGMSAIYYTLVDNPSFITLNAARTVFVLTYLSLFIPLLYMMAYLVNRFVFSCKRCKDCRQKIADKFRRANLDEQEPLLVQNTRTSITHSSISNPNSPSTEVPDRLGRPDRYNDMTWATSSVDMSYSLDSTSIEDRNPPRKLHNISQYGSTAEIFEPDTY